MTPAAAAKSAAAGWRWRHLLLATLVLVTSASWWALVQLDRAGLGPGLPWALSPSLVHAGVMTFGFIPLFFAGFLFTAGPPLRILLAAACLWAGLLATWGVRHGDWYGCLRADGRPG